MRKRLLAVFLACCMAASTASTVFAADDLPALAELPAVAAPADPDPPAAEEVVVETEVPNSTAEPAPETTETRRTLLPSRPRNPCPPRPLPRSRQPRQHPSRRRNLPRTDGTAHPRPPPPRQPRPRLAWSRRRPQRRSLPLRRCLPCPRAHGQPDTAAHGQPGFTADCGGDGICRRAGSAYTRADGRAPCSGHAGSTGHHQHRRLLYRCRQRQRGAPGRDLHLVPQPRWPELGSRSRRASAPAASGTSPRAASTS